MLPNVKKKKKKHIYNNPEQFNCIKECNPTDYL